MTKRSPFRYFRTLPEVIRQAVLRYIWFPLSLRNVEGLQNERGTDVSHESVRFWWQRFRLKFASEFRKNRVQYERSHSNRKWRLDEMFVKISGERTTYGELSITKARCLKAT